MKNINSQQRAKTPYEKELVAELKAANQQLAEIRKQMTGMEREKRLLSVMSDNAERRRRTNNAEKKLHCLYNEKLAECCANLAFIFDSDLRLRMATRSALAMLDCDRFEDMEDAAPRTIFSSKMNMVWVERIEAECREVMGSRKEHHYEDRISFAEGAGYMDAKVSIVPMLCEDTGSLQGVLLSLDDMTELTVTREHAEEAARLKSSFLANMSHEIRTPMNAIKGLAELLMMTGLSELQNTYVSNIISSSNSLLAIISDLLDFSRISADNFDIIKSRYSLGEMLKDVCSAISLRAQEKGLELVVDIDPALPDNLYGDDSRLKQVLVNVLGNAVKYTEKGTVTLKVGGDKKATGNINLKFLVKDTGAGIKHEEIPMLFEAFSRADLRVNRSIMGTGLGLALSKSLMQAMNGDISVKSVYGKGSSFSFWLPQKIVADAPVARVEQADKKKVLILDEGRRGKELALLLGKLGVPHVHLKDTRDRDILGWEDATHCIYFENYDIPSLGKLRGSMPDANFVVINDIRRALEKNKFADVTIYEPVLIIDLANILNLNRKSELSRTLHRDAAASDEFKVCAAAALVVDDNDLNLMVACEILRSFGFEVSEAASGAEAVEKCREQAFDLIFMDHMMPMMDGIEAAMHIREAPGQNLKTPVIVLTANVVGGMKDYFLRCGMDDMVSKPIDVSDLARAILTWMPQRKIVRCGNEPGVNGGAKAPDFDMVKLLDDFGMYANDVMRELDGDLQAYIDRLGLAGGTLGGIVRRLHDLVRAEDWPGFSLLIGELKDLLHGIGARDCAVRAKKMEIASGEGNISYVHQDFKSLMGNMYMLERKLDTLVPLALGVPGEEDCMPNNMEHLCSLLQDLNAALSNGNIAGSGAVIDKLARYSFDHDLDMRLNEVRWAVEDRDFENAIKLSANALSFYRKKALLPA